MPGTKTFLSFCVPTYNRPKEFERLMRGVLPQLTPDTELVIRDDSSNNDTAAIVDRLIASSGVRYRYIHGEKIGLDLANMFLLEQAEGEYVWWFSDDDELLPGAIARVLRIFKAYPEIDFMWANFVYGEDKRYAVEQREDKFFGSRDDVLAEIGTNLGLLSTLIMKREAAMPYLPLGREKATGFAFAGLIPVLGILSGPGRFYYLAGPYIHCHPTTPEEIKKIVTRKGEVDNKGFETFGINYFEILTIFKNAFSWRIMKRNLAVNFGHVWRGILVGTARGYDTPKGKRWKMFKYYWNFPELWVALPLFLLPAPAIRGLYRLYSIFFFERKLRSFGK